MQRPVEAAEQLPQAATIQGYTVLEQLGRGGMGVVYRVRDPATGEELALKTVRTATKETIAAIRHEFRMLSGLRIPGVVRVRHAGVAQGLPYYLMECVSGQPLRACEGFDGRGPAGSGDRVRSLRTSLGDEVDAAEPPSRSLSAAATTGILPESTLTVFARLCVTLVELHGEGIVHGDLKPENVIVRPDGQPVIVDFARASHFYGRQGRDRLDIDADALGTPAYMAPEQFDGQIVDARADLYAVGCMLYELATGRVPFGGSAGEIRAGHVHAVPLAASLQNLDLPPELARLISRLLEKDPVRRPGHASDVLRVLARSGYSGAVELRQTSRPCLYRPVLVGRARELERIERACTSAGGELLFIGGSSGIGKTRLLLELGARARGPEGQVVSGECLPIPASRESSSARGGALHPFRAFLLDVADRCQLLGALESERLLGVQGRLLEVVEPALATVPKGATAGALKPLPASVSARQLGDALASVLCAWAAGGRVLVLLDDLQWADDVTLSWLQRIFSADLELDQISIVATYRKEELTERHAWIANAPESRLVSLVELGQSEVDEMLSSMLALPACPLEITRLVADRSGGNPLFVGEYLRLAVEQGTLSRGEVGQWRVGESPGAAPRESSSSGAGAAPTTPESLRQILLQRVERLSSAARSVALAAATLGREGELSLLEALAGEELLERALDELVAREVLQLGPAGTFRFSHDKLREQVYESGAIEEQRRWHGRAAAELERSSQVAADPLLWILLAHHLARAEEQLRSFVYLERAADYFLATGAHADAIDILSRAVRGEARARELGAGTVSPARLGSWERRISVAHLHLGRMDDCGQHALRALALLRGQAPQSAPGWGLHLVAHLAQQVSHWLLPRRLYQRPKQRANLVEVAQTAAAISRASFYSGDTLRMVTASLMAVNAAERADSREDTPRDFASIGYICSLFGATRLTQHYFAQAREAKQSYDALVLEALYRLGQGQWAEAVGALSAAEAASAEAADPQDAETVQTLLGHAEHYVGHFQAAITRYSRVLASARRRKNRQSEAWALYCTARSLIALGFPERGVDLCEQALQALAEEPDLLSQVTALGILLSGAAAGRQLSRAEGPAALLEKLLHGARPTAFVMLHGWEGFSEYQLACWQLARGAGRVNAEVAASRAARAAIGRLLKVVRIFPLAEPWAWRLRARALLLAGKTRGARVAFERSARTASRLGMLFDEALAHAGLAQTFDPSSADQDLVRKMHSDRATAVFSQLGCVREA